MERSMGITYAEVGIENTLNKRRIDTRALVDSGSVFFTVPEHIATQLGFDVTEVSTREVLLADGSRKTVPMIDPVRVYFANRYCSLSALVMGDEPLLGAVAMEMMDVQLHPASQTLVVNPESPYIPVAIAKQSSLNV
jgi:clan AA aspartic protease